MITATKMASAARGKAGQTHHVNRGARPKARGAVTTSARASGAMRQHNQPQPQPIQQKIFTGTDGDTHEKKTRASTRASLSSCPSFRSSDGGDRLLTQAHTYFHLSSSTLTDFCVPFFFSDAAAGLTRAAHRAAVQGRTSARDERVVTRVAAPESPAFAALGADGQKRTDLKKIAILGAGPIVIGQACEFDYSGTQACKALKSEGYEIVLVNSNPATIMTDPGTADRTYVGPMTPDSVREILEKERPDALLPTMGGQTALNLAKALAERGDLEELGIELIGAKLDAINVAEDRLLFKEAMDRIGLNTPPSGTAENMEEAYAIQREIGNFPIIIRPAFTLGGTGGGIAYNMEEFNQIVQVRADAAVHPHTPCPLHKENGD